MEDNYEYDTLNDDVIIEVLRMYGRWTDEALEKARENVLKTSFSLDFKHFLEFGICKLDGKWFCDNDETFFPLIDETKKVKLNATNYEEVRAIAGRVNKLCGAGCAKEVFAVLNSKTLTYHKSKYDISECIYWDLWNNQQIGKFFIKNYDKACLTVKERYINKQEASAEKLKEALNSLGKLDNKDT